MGNGEAKLSPRGKSRGLRREVGGQAVGGAWDPRSGGTQDVLLHRGTDTRQAPLPPSLGADRGWHIPGTHTYMNTHTHAHASLSARQPGPQSPEAQLREPALSPQCLAWTIKILRKRLALREASWDLVVGRVHRAQQPPARTGWPMARALDPSQPGCPGLGPACSPRPPWLHPS